jgi:hypothetical protein
MRGTTTVYGTVVRVDGLTVDLLTLTGERLSATCGGSLADSLSARVGSEVGLDGDAVWGPPPDMPMVSFAITRLLPYRRTPIIEAFAELREAVDGAYDGVDADAYVRELRGDDG